MDDSQEFDTDVMVIGLGPAGATTALALATYGIRVQAVTMFNWLANSPRAHITNQRAVEVFRDLGIEAEIKKYATPWEKMGDTLFTTSLAGEEILRLQTWGTGDGRHGDYLEGSPCPMLDVPQPLVEPILVKNAAARGAIVSLNTEYLSHIEDTSGVTVTLRDTVTGATIKRRVRFLVGMDGARSKVAEDIDLPFEGELARAGTAYVLFNADLSRYVERRPSILHWIVNARAGFGEIGMGLLRAIKPWHQWIAGWGFDITAGEPDLDDATVIAQIRTLVGDPELEVELLTKSIWYVNQQYATRYSRGRVLCGGDAVHRHPPSSGLGSNTCIQDAFNLAWKLAFVVQGNAGQSLLESYSDERVPIGRQVVERANLSRKEYAGLREWFDHDAEDPVAAGLIKLKAPTQEGVRLRENLYAALDLKNTEFNAHGVELNQRYTSSAVVSDTSAEPEVWSRDRQLYLQATTRPGAKLPHVWLVDGHGRRTSTLDVVGQGKFTLLTGLSGAAWREAGRQLNQPYLSVVVIGESPTLDPYGHWHAAREIHEAGATLVRPDGYVAWRQCNPVWEADRARDELERALASILAQAPPATNT